MKVLIIGGVAGGATTATRLRRLDEKAEIIVFEKGAYVSFANCGLPYYVGDVIVEKEDLILQTPKSFKNRFNIDVRIKNEVLSIDRENKTVLVKDLVNNKEYKESYDKLVLSPGAETIIPNIEISGNVFTLRNIPDTYKVKDYIDNNEVKSATIVGGGYIGIELAENLVEIGINVTIVELSNQLIGPLDSEMATFVHSYLKQKGINIILKNAVTSIKEDNDKTIVNLNDGTFIESDLVVLSVGVKPESILAKKANIDINQKGSIIVNNRMQTSDKDIYALGDVVEVVNFVTKEKDFIPLAGPANKQARVVADNICNIDRVYNGTQGSSILKIFNMSVAMTGINEKVAKKNNINYGKIYISTNSHATYYPDSKPLYIKVIYEKNTGKILGSQIIGFESVDKRIDVLATAIRFNMIAYDLEELELSYAPPFSSAKDPVNIIGNIIVNELKGNVKNIYSEDIEKMSEGRILLDVRTEKEYELGHIKNSINIPLDSLRENLSKLDKSKEIIINCQSGLRSYIAYRILVSNGYTVYNLTGGYLFYKAYLSTI